MREYIARNRNVWPYYSTIYFIRQVVRATITAAAVLAATLILFMRVLQHTATRCSVRYLSSSSVSSRVPWFIDSSEASPTQQTSSQKGTLPSLPPGIPVALRTLHAQLAQSPYLEPSKLLVRDPIPQPPGPPLPLSAPRGRRKRGGTYSGEGLLDPGNLWNWIVLAQVRPSLAILCRATAYDSCRLKKGQKSAGLSSLLYGSSERRCVVENCQSTIVHAQVLCSCYPWNRPSSFQRKVGKTYTTVGPW